MQVLSLAQIISAIFWHLFHSLNTKLLKYFKVSANISLLLPSLPSLPAASPRWPGSPGRQGRARCPAWPPPLPGHRCQSVWSCAQTPASHHHHHHITKKSGPSGAKNWFPASPWEVRSSWSKSGIRKWLSSDGRLLKCYVIQWPLAISICRSHDDRQLLHTYCWTNVVITPSSALSWGSLLSKRGRN